MAGRLVVERQGWEWEHSGVRASRVIRAEVRWETLASLPVGLGLGGTRLRSEAR
jgi:hypothetical protein